MDIETRLASLDRGQVEILRRIDKVDTEITDLKDSVRDTMIEIGGVPDEIGRDPSRRSLRSRIHYLENDRSARELQRATIDAARELRESAGRERFSRREKLVGLFFAGLVALGPYLAPLFFHQ